MMGTVVMQNQSQIAVHLGAHRTGTTLLQEYLYKITPHAGRHGCTLIGIDETRTTLMKEVLNYRDMMGEAADGGARAQAKLKEKLRIAKENGGKLFLSEENIIGTMEMNLREKDVYPNVRSRLDALTPSFSHVDTFYLSIRPLEQWWSSCLSYLISAQTSPPSPDHVRALSQSKRTWVDVVQDIQAVFPDARLIVREFRYLVDNPKRQLIKATGWKFAEETKRLKRKSNRSKDVSKLRDILEKRGDYLGAERIVGSDGYMAFTSDQIDALRDRYKHDVAWMRANLTGKHQFLENPQT